MLTARATLASDRQRILGIALTPTHDAMNHDDLWGADAVDHALRYETPERVTTALNDGSAVQTGRSRRQTSAPGHRAQPWPKFCSIVWIISGAPPRTPRRRQSPSTLLGDDSDDDR